VIDSETSHSGGPREWKWDGAMLVTLHRIPACSGRGAVRAGDSPAVPGRWPQQNYGKACAFRMMRTLGLTGN
jgi:hypothetical protein